MMIKRLLLIFALCLIAGSAARAQVAPGVSGNCAQYTGSTPSFLLSDAGAPCGTGGGGGTVTSVGLALANLGWLNVTSSTTNPITSTGTFTITPVSSSANMILATPNGSTGIVSLRSLVNADLPASGVSAGTYNSVTVNAQGIVTAGTNTGGGDVTSVASLSANIVITPTTGAVTVVSTDPINSQSGTTYTLLSSDATKTIALTSASAVAVTIPSTGTAGFGSGYAATICAQSANATLTPASGTIAGLASFDLLVGQCADVWSDGINYQAAVAQFVKIIANAGATGTTVFKTAKLTGAPSTVVIMATSDTSGFAGVVTAGAGTSGSAQLQSDGIVPLVMDGATTAGDFVQISTTVAGDGHDTGASTCPVANGQILGRVLTTNGGGGTYNVALGQFGCGSPNLTLTSAHVFVGNASNVATDVALSQDCTMANTGAITCTKTNNVAFGTAATVNTGTSGATIPLLNGTNTWSGVQSFNDGDLSLNGSSSGNSVLHTSATGGGAITFQAGAHTVASTTLADQTLSGGFNTTSTNQGTKSSGTYTVDCGANPNQYFTNGGAFTLAAPSNDGSCNLLDTNNASAGTITFSGFTVGANTGDSLTNTNTSKFIIQIVRINSVASYSVRALQ